ncbi:MAG: MMPL family transporter [Candidatus Marinimicrobia bacterium]|nr:MMPL family transporter [Candidatus Neomarinimicrobiota bacterium]
MEQLIQKLTGYPKSILLAAILITVVFFQAIKSNARMETNLDEYMPENHPAFVYSDEAENWFNIKDGIIMAIENQNGIYNSETLQRIKDLTKRLQKFEEIEKADVTSLYTADNIVGTENGMDVKSFFSRVPRNDEDLRDLREKVKANDMVYGKLVSQNETVSIIVARIGNDVFSQEFYQELLDLAHEYEEAGSDKVYIAGRPIVEGTMAVLGPADMKRMVPIVLIVIVLVLYLLLRNFKSTFLILAIVSFSSIWAFGLMAAMDIPIYAVSTMIPVMLIAIGVAYGIHLYSHLHMFQLENPDTDRRTAVDDLIKEMWNPVLMAAITTAVGFISLLTSQVYPIKYFGAFSAFGVLVAFTLSILVIPAGLLLFGLPKVKQPGPSNDQGHDVERFAHRSADFFIKNKKQTYLATALVILLSMVGMSRVWIDSSFLDKFEKDSDIVLTDKFINENFGGTSTLNVILEGNQANKFKEPDALKALAKMQNNVEKSLPIVGDSFSIADFLKRMNKVMNADDEAFNTIPDNQDLIAQYLLLYEMSGDPENLWQVVTDDFKKVNLTFQLKSDNSKALNSAIDIVEEYRQDFEALGIEVNYAGSGYKALVFTDLILEGQISSLLMSLVIVVILLGLIFKNYKLGLIGAIPIVVTTFISFGVMGILNIPLSSTTALISSIAIGIGIDYAVHFIDRYRINALESQNRKLAIRQTMYHSGRAIVFNAIVVIAGFMVLLASVFPPNRILGGLISLNMLTSFIGTLTVMAIALYYSKIFITKGDEK